jgi:hypothetical protein
MLKSLYILGLISDFYVPGSITQTHTQMSWCLVNGLIVDVQLPFEPKYEVLFLLTFVLLMDTWVFHFFGHYE